MKNSNRNHNICLLGYGMMTCVDVFFAEMFMFHWLKKKTTLYWKKETFNFFNIPNSHTVPNQDDSSEDYTFVYAGRTVPNGLLLRTANHSQLACQQRTLFRLLILYPSWKKQISLVFSDTVQDCNMSYLAKIHVWEIRVLFCSLLPSSHMCMNSPWLIHRKVDNTWLGLVLFPDCT